MLKLDNICLSFDGQQVIKNLCLELKAGERIALMGPSGGGKTSLLRIIAGLLKPDSGEIHNDFHQLSFMFQEPRLLPWLKAWENVNLLLSDNDSTKAQALALLCHFDLCEDGEKYPHELSGGMQQRVALARALAVDADLFLMDEPFKAMDEALQEQAGIGTYDIVVANILAPVIIMLTGEADRHLKPGGIFITSGIINMKEEAVKEAFAAHPVWEVLETTYQGEWVSITARKRVSC